MKISPGFNVTLAEAQAEGAGGGSAMNSEVQVCIREAHVRVFP
jgi:hypothetical protein